jgi:hypothetical protein
VDQIKKHFSPKNFLFKLLISLILALLCLALFISSAQATDTTNLIFINHTRGTECCDKGSLKNFELQLETFVKNDLPAFFALRYDAMTNPSFIKVIKKYQNNSKIKFGVMLEITPQLAQNSFVEYKDTPENWFQAQNAFLIGYSPEDRILLADEIFDAYYEIFRQYPELTTAWQVDTPTLNYLQEKYGVIAHQIAREQWGLDSYTLDGGPPHYPYLASKNWIFNPDFTDPNNLLIIRHTIDDPLYTYGDDSSSFTSQPNDYTLDKKDFGYFEKLLEQTTNQANQTGFANLGLENSMALSHQQEYVKQISKVASLCNKNKIKPISNLKVLKVKTQSQKISIHQGQDLITDTNQKVFWITTPKYRLRLRFQNQKVFISDLRVYHPNLTDPYAKNSATNKGYLISPYLINDGIKFLGISSPTWAQRFLGIPMINSFTAQPNQDLSSNANLISLPRVTDFSSIKIGSRNMISYQSEDETIAFSFNEDTFDIRNIEKDQIEYIAPKFSKSPLKFKKTAQENEIFWEINKEKALNATWSCTYSLCHFEFSLDPTKFPEMISNQYPFIFPEKKARPLSKEKTIVYLHNRYAIAGRNPARIVLVPQDENGFPTNSENDVVVQTSPEANFTKLEKQTTSREFQLLDISHNTSGKIKLNLTLDEIELPEQTIYFAPNCKTELTYCLTRPHKLWWYLQTIFQDKFRAKLLGEKQ